MTEPTMFERGLAQGLEDAKRPDWDMRLYFHAYGAAHLPTLLPDVHDQMSAGYMVGIVRGLRELADQEQEARA